MECLRVGIWRVVGGPALTYEPAPIVDPSDANSSDSVAGHRLTVLVPTVIGVTWVSEASLCAPSDLARSTPYMSLRERPICQDKRLAFHGGYDRIRP